MKRITKLCLLTLCALWLCLLPLRAEAAETVASGTCGDNLTWTLDGDGLLTISGEGAMENYGTAQDTKAPWLSSGYSVSRLVVEDGVTNIGNYAFYGSGLSEITLADSVTTIGEFSFGDCTLFRYKLKIGDGVKYIGEYAFFGCMYMEYIAIPKSVISIGDCAFQGCGALSSGDVFYAGTQEEWDKITIGEWNNRLTDSHIHFPTFSGTCGENLTWTLDSNGLLTISGEGDMYDYRWINSSDGTWAPWRDNYYTEIKSVVIEKGVTSIGECAFYACWNITSLTIPEGVTAIRRSAMYSCKSLTDITIPKSVSSIEDYAFVACSALTNLTIPGSVTSIGEAVFNGCDSLICVTILDGVPGIGSNMFAGCDNLASVTIPASVTSIGDAAFRWCTSLTDVYFGSTQGVWDQITIGVNNEPLQNAQIHFLPADRVSGENRWNTATTVADQLKTVLGVEKFNAIILSCGSDSADALAGSYLSAAKSAPILLSYGGDLKQYAYLDTNNIAYIQENLAEGGTVYILGGEDAVPELYEDGLANYNVVRLAGENRFETNQKILNEVEIAPGSEVLVCTAYNFADSLSASATGKPILLVYTTEKGKNYGVDDAFLQSLNGCKFTILGGEDAVSASVETILQGYGTVERLAGDTRFETSVMVAEKYFDSPDSAVLAYAWNYPDGLCGGALAYAMNAPLILTMDKWESAAAQYVQSGGTMSGYVLGGTDLVSDATVRTIFDMANSTAITTK